MSEITLIRKEGKPSWIFKWSETHSGYIYKTRNSTYKIFFDNCMHRSAYNLPPDIWIGRLVEGKFWYTCETIIKAKTLVMFRGNYNFHARNQNT